MNFEQLKHIWTNENPGVEVSINKLLLNEFTAIKLQEDLQEIKWSSIIEVIITSFWLIFLIGFSINHFMSLKFLIPAIILIVISIFSMVLEANKLKLFHSIKHQFSILEAQKKIEKLNFLELLDINSLYLIIPIFFVPFLIVFAKGFIGLDLFEFGLDLSIIFNLTLGSVVVAIVVAYFLRKYTLQRLKQSIDFLKDIEDIKKD